MSLNEEILNEAITSEIIGEILQFFGELEVGMSDLESGLDVDNELKKKYKKIMILAHPDKNDDDKERSVEISGVIENAWSAYRRRIMPKGWSWEKMNHIVKHGTKHWDSSDAHGSEYKGAGTSEGIYSHPLSQMFSQCRDGEEWNWKKYWDFMENASKVSAKD